MPQERTSQFPFPTAEEAAASPGGREIKAARNVVSRRIDGIPKRGYITGDCDSAPVIKGVADLTEAAYALLDEIARMNEPDPLTNATAADLDPDGFGSLVREAEGIRAIMEDHRCPPATADA